MQITVTLLFFTDFIASFLTNYAYFQSVMLDIVKSSMGLTRMQKVPPSDEFTNDCHFLARGPHNVNCQGPNTYAERLYLSPVNKLI